MKKIIPFFIAVFCVASFLSACKKKEYCSCTSYFKGEIADTYEREKQEGQNCTDFEDGAFQIYPDSTGISCK